MVNMAPPWISLFIVWHNLFISIYCLLLYRPIKNGYSCILNNYLLVRLSESGYFSAGLCLIRTIIVQSILAYLFVFTWIKLPLAASSYIGQMIVDSAVYGFFLTFLCTYHILPVTSLPLLFYTFNSFTQDTNVSTLAYTKSLLICNLFITLG